jgi:phosphohistidine phosphatase
MILIFFRHGLALDRSESITKGVEDGDRHLLKEGKEKTKKMGEVLGRLGFKIDEIFSSPFLRAVETAEVLKKTLEIKGNIIISEDLLPERNFPDFLSYLRNRNTLSEVMLFVGHEPNLSHLVSTVLGGKKSFIEIKKSGFVVLEIDTVADLPAGNGKLQAVVPPKIA